MSRRARTLLGALVILGALGYLLAAGIGDNLVYFLTPTELLAKGEAAHDVPFRLNGTVVPGSVRWDAQSLDLRFQLADEETSVDVHSTGMPPEMFHEGMDVIVEGSLSENRVFQAHTLMVKHSNEYAPADDHPAADRFPELPSGQGGAP